MSGIPTEELKLESLFTLQNGGKKRRSKKSRSSNKSSRKQK